METVHHLYIARLKAYIDDETYDGYRGRYLECVRMLNGLERTLEEQIDKSSRRWPTGPETRILNPEP